MEGTKEKTTMEDIFNLFVEKKPENKFCLNPVMLKPFHFNGKVYATDRHSIISTDNGNIDFILDNEYEPINCEKVTPKSNTSEIINITQSSDWFEQFKTKYEVKEIECNECEGLGVIECCCCRKENDCDDCHGTGYFREKTDNKIFEDACIKFKDAFLDIKLFYKLIRVRDFTKKPIELKHYDGAMDAIVFRVGIFDVLLMPLYNPIKRECILTIE
jgi:hypothetical protein